MGLTSTSVTNGDAMRMVAISGGFDNGIVPIAVNPA